MNRYPEGSVENKLIDIQKSSFRLPQTRLSVAERIACVAGRAGVAIFGRRAIGFILDNFSQNQDILPRWFVHSLLRGDNGYQYLNRPEVRAGDRELVFKRCKNPMRAWDAICKWAAADDLSQEELWYLLDLATGKEHRQEAYNTLRVMLAGRKELEWGGLLRLLESDSYRDSHKTEIIDGALTKKAPFNRFGKELVNWILKQPDRERYFAVSYTHKFFVAARASTADDDQWFKIAGELIQASPTMSLVGVLDMRFDWGPGDFGGLTEEDFIGAPKQIFAPWLADTRILRGHRIRAVQWLGRLGILEAERAKAREGVVGSSAKAPEARGPARAEMGGEVVTKSPKPPGPKRLI